MSKKNQPLRIRFRPDESIGDPDAGNDSFYLKECFVDTAFFDNLTDMSNGKSLLIGRTGTGKTACIQRIKHLSETQNLKCVEVDVAQNFLGYISGLDLLNKWADTNKHNLTLFFKNMWKHIVIVNIIKKEFTSSDKFINQIYKFFSPSKKKEDERRKQLEAYVDSYGEDFWHPWHSTSDVVKSTMKEIAIEGRVGIPGGDARASYRQATSAQGNESQDKIHTYFNKQRLQLQAAIDSVSQYIRGNGRGSFYVLIDKLDEEWLVDDDLRYHLIRSLVETVRDLYHGNDEHPIKVVVAMRTDLIRKVYEVTRSVGWQSEKYHAFETLIEWSRKDLASIVNKRIHHMCRHRYTTQPISIQDLAPPPGRDKKTQDKKLLDHIMDRTLGRPRDVISFVNHILRHLGKEGRDRLTRSMLNDVGRMYSAERFESVIEEWQTLYPNLEVYASILKDKSFRSRVNFVQFQEIVEHFVLRESSVDDPTLQTWEGMLDKKLHNVAVDFLSILYRTGLVRVKPDALSSPMTYPNPPEPISVGQCEKEMSITIHPMFYGKFGIDKST